MANRYDPTTGNKNYFNESVVDRVKYVGLRNWMIKKQISILELERRCGCIRLNHSLTGNSEPRKGTIDAVLAATGLSYEECFKEE